LVIYGNQIKCFFEGIKRSDEYGKIYSIEIQDSSARRYSPKLELDTGSHASFPFVFNEADHLYLVVENSKSGKLNIRKYESTTNEWEVVSSIRNAANLFDPIIFREYDNYFLLASERLKGDTIGSYASVLFQAQSLEGPWAPIDHLRIWSDNLARNAGIASDKLLFQSYALGMYGFSIYAWHTSNTFGSTLINPKIQLFKQVSGKKTHHFCELNKWVVTDISRY
jgi:hypothetical protein